MRPEIAAAIEELKRQFPDASISVNPDGSGGEKVIIDPVRIGERYEPQSTWLGFHITAQYPYADIYPMFISGDVKRVDGKAFAPPVTNGHTFEGRPAIQVSRRSAAATAGSQKAVAKVLKIIDFLEKYQ